VSRSALLLALVVLPVRAEAIRPFITDDARVVGRHTLQLETWVQAEATQLQHWVLPAFGPTERLELTIGAVHGATYGDGPATYAVAGPLLQAKWLVRAAVPNRGPGFALAGGVVTPLGRGGFQTPGGAGFAFLAITESIGDAERLLIHANLGLSIGEDWMTPTFGVGAQLRVVAGLHVIGEIVYGDSYAGDNGGAVQAGFRYIFGDHVQMDGTAGVGLWGAERRPPWGTLGLRIVSNQLW